MSGHNSQLFPKKLFQILKNRLRVKPFRQSGKALANWFESPIGQYQLETESRLIREQLSNLFGYHLMQLSVCENTEFAQASRINHYFSLYPSFNYLDGQSNVSGITDFDALPLDDEQIDVTILHHVLEFSENPHQVLKEAARVTMPRGYLIIVCFNPVSLDGLFRFVGRLFSDRPIWQRHSLQTRRMRDWLEFLDFSCVTTKFASYNLSINNKHYLTSSGFIERILGRNELPFGSSYCLVARKDKLGMTPIKPRWQSASLMEGMPVPKQAMKVPRNRKAHILPFRTPIKKR